MSKSNPQSRLLQKQLQKRAARLVAKLEAAIATPSDNGHWADDSLSSEARELGLTLLEDLYGEQHRTFQRFKELTSQFEMARMEKACGVGRAVEAMVSDDWLTKTRTLMSAELFDDFLDMAEHLLDEQYKDAAAVIAGGSLESHLRRLAGAAGVPVQQADKNGKMKPKRAENLNEELHKTKAYKPSTQKQVTAWLAIRNNAAHANYADVDDQEVKLMIGGIRLFIAQHPA